MHPDVISERRVMRKLIPAEDAAVRLLPCVSSIVPPQVGSTGESFPASDAGVRPLAGVSSHMTDVVWLTFEPFPTGATFKTFFTSVGPRVKFEL